MLRLSRIVLDEDVLYPLHSGCPYGVHFALIIFAYTTIDMKRDQLRVNRKSCRIILISLNS